MLIKTILLLVGVFFLFYSGNKLIDFSVALASKKKLSPALVGLTIVSIGTSLPELFVSLLAAIQGSPEIAVANVVGSNISNIGLVLGSTAILSVLPAKGTVIKFDFPIMIIASFICLILMRDGSLDTVESSFLLVSMVSFLGLTIYLSKRDKNLAEETSEVLSEDLRALSQKSLPILILGIFMSFAGLALGSRLLVDSAVFISKAFGLSERIIGLTLVAVGTSLPELITSLMAGLKGQTELAIANVIGSNISNLLLILGTAGVIHNLPISNQFIALDNWIMLGFSVLAFVLIFWKKSLGRLSGGLILGLYISYIVALGFSK